MSNRALCRDASHAGSWYTASGTGGGEARLGVGGHCMEVRPLLNFLFTKESLSLHPNMSQRHGGAW